jgi:uncharacterized protein YabE (DUF348 family)
MPTVFRQGPYRFYFYSHDLVEPLHVHVDAGGKTAKVWLNPISVANSIGFNAIELGELQRLVDQHRAQILEAWREHFRK